VAVGQVTEQQRTQAGAADVRRGRPAGDLAGRDVQAAARLRQPARDAADDGDLEAIEDPYGAEADDDDPVPSRPRQAIEARRDLGPDSLVAYDLQARLRTAVTAR
jgi:hypothetical protein